MLKLISTKKWIATNATHSRNDDYNDSVSAISHNDKYSDSNNTESRNDIKYRFQII